ncbi:hypothetical protein PGTUg99_026808 [Puccinia graminis f. sp. tritici]|uniref:Uncharacterized protein n=1 Tax=Puccinia graminis f. sp. tritici TaxID=56615 RepID=A0A5B0SKT3_PUCGR|nr:hypothetical protein PGTUg99_026808 [Puccinia graminis f. sp. tritici]
MIKWDLRLNASETGATIHGAAIQLARTELRHHFYTQAGCNVGPQRSADEGPDDTVTRP